jgi:hypothetical protein
MARNYDPPDPMREAIEHDAWNTIPGQPRGSRLIYSAPLSYQAFDTDRTVWRPLRLWSTDAGIVAVVTEIGDDGPSVTNSAEKVYAAMTEAAPGCRVIEHYPPSEGTRTAETFDEITLGDDGEPVWRHILTAELRAELGDSLDTTRPYAPVGPDAGQES